TRPRRPPPPHRHARRHRALARPRAHADGEPALLDRRRVLDRGAFPAPGSRRLTGPFHRPSRRPLPSPVVEGARRPAVLCCRPPAGRPRHDVVDLAVLRRGVAELGVAGAVPHLHGPPGSSPPTAARTAGAEPPPRSEEHTS